MGTTTLRANTDELYIPEDILSLFKAVQVRNDHDAGNYVMSATVLGVLCQKIGLSLAETLEGIHMDNVELIFSGFSDNFLPCLDQFLRRGEIFFEDIDTDTCRHVCEELRSDFSDLGVPVSDDFWTIHMNPYPPSDVECVLDESPSSSHHEENHSQRNPSRKVIPTESIKVECVTIDDEDMDEDDSRNWSDYDTQHHQSSWDTYEKPVATPVFQSIGHHVDMNWVYHVKDVRHSSGPKNYSHLTASVYKKRWQSFEGFCAGREPNEQIFIDYFTSVHNERNFKSNKSLRAWYSSINSKYKELYGKRLQDFPRLTALIKSYD